ncbi:crossover junction endonuclease Mus81p [Diutina rugosa]
MDAKSLFEQWAVEVATLSAQKGSRSASLYSKIVRSLRNFPNPINDYETLRSVPGVGVKTVEMLCARLKVWCEENNEIFPESFNVMAKPKTQARKRSAVEETESGSKPKRKKLYIPAPRSGGHGIMVALYLLDKRQRGVTRDEIIPVAKNYCNSSFSAGSGSHYSAWNSIKTLMRHEYIEKIGPRYCLTDSALGIAKELTEKENVEDFDDSVAYSSPPPSPPLAPCSPTVSDTRNQPRVLVASDGRHYGKYKGISFRVYEKVDLEVVVLVDNREIRSSKDRAFFEEELLRAGVKCESRTLPVGDMVWVARHKISKKEVLLDVIAERKRIDDLASSIKDGRYHEQKDRLRKTGMTHYYYLVEELRNMTVTESLIKAIASTMASGFYLRRLSNTENTVSLIADITRLVTDTLRDVVVISSGIDSQSQYLSTLLDMQQAFGDKYCVTHNYHSFREVFTKSQFTVGEMFINMLMAIRGVSYQKALAIQQQFSTPKSLIEFFRSNQNLSETDKCQLISKRLANEISSRKIGNKCSENIYLAWGRL